MNRLFLFLLTIIVSSFSGTALAADASDINESDGSLIIGIVQEENFPLVYFDTQKNPKGFEVEMARHLAKIGDYTIKEIRQFPDKRSLRQALINKEIDFAFSKLKKNQADAERFIYSESHLTIRYVFLFNRIAMAQNGLQINPLQKLTSSGLPVGTLESPLYDAQLQRIYPGMNVKSYQSKPEVFDAIVAGDITACYMDEMEVKSFFLTHPSKALYLYYLQGETLSDSVALVFPWNKLFFREWVNMFLAKYGYIDTKLEDIIERYSPDFFGIQKN